MRGEESLAVSCLVVVAGNSSLQEERRDGTGRGEESEGKEEEGEKRRAERRAKREEKKTPHHRFCIQGLIVKLVDDLGSLLPLLPSPI